MDERRVTCYLCVGRKGDKPTRDGGGRLDEKKKKAELDGNAKTDREPRPASEECFQTK